MKFEETLLLDMCRDHVGLSTHKSHWTLVAPGKSVINLVWGSGEKLEFVLDKNGSCSPPTIHCTHPHSSGPIVVGKYNGTAIFHHIIDVIWHGRFVCGIDWWMDGKRVVERLSKWINPSISVGHDHAFMFAPTFVFASGLTKMPWCNHIQCSRW